MAQVLLRWQLSFLIQLHGHRMDAFGHAGQGVHKRPDAKKQVRWHAAVKQRLRQARHWTFE